MTRPVDALVAHLNDAGGIFVTTARLGALSAIVFAVAGIAWFALEIAPPALGFEDTDSPAVMLPFLREHSELSIYAGLALIVMAICLTVATFAVWDALEPRADSLAARSTSAFGIFSAAFFLMHGVVRLAAEPLLYIDGLSHAWGEAAYLIVQVIGIHGFAQAGSLALCMWAVGISLIGLRTRTLPLALCMLGVIPGLRLLGLLGGPLNVLPDVLWIVFMLAIPGVMLWCLLLGLVLLRRAFMASVKARVERLPVPTPS
jgi:hypothetical protein